MSRFGKQAATLVSGTALAQILALAIAPVLTRLYSPEDFGVFAIYSGILATITCIAGLRYEFAIPLARSKSQATHVLLVALSATALVTVCTGISIVLFGQWLAKFIEAPELTAYLWIMPIGVLIIGVYQAFHFWAIREERFKTVAATKFAQAAGTMLLQISAYKLQVGGLIIGHTFGQAIGTVRLLKASQLLSKNIRVRKRYFIWALKRYRDFPMYSSWGALLNTIGTQFPPVLFAMIFSPAAAGFYSLSQRVLSAPINLIGRSVATVFIAHSARARDKESLGSLVFQIQDKLTQIVMPGALALILIGPDLFNRIFGERWTESGEIAQLMTPWLLAVFIVSPLSPFYETHERQKIGILFQSILLICRAISILIGGYFGNFMLAVALFSISSAICWLALLIWIFVSTRASVSSLGISAVRAAGWAGAINFPIIAVDFIESSENMKVGAVILVAGLFLLRSLAILRKHFS